MQSVKKKVLLFQITSSQERKAHFQRDPKNEKKRNLALWLLLLLGMGDLEKRDRAEEEEEEEKERFLEGMAVVDFDMLCSTVALQAQQGKWRSFENVGEEEEEGGEFGGVLRMWEGEVQDCFDDRRISIESAW
jgi:hypothetical protein